MKNLLNQEINLMVAEVSRVNHQEETLLENVYINQCWYRDICIS